MKNFKRFVSMALAIVMCLSLFTTALASDGDDFTGPDDDGANTDVTWNFTGADEDLNQLEDEELPLVTSFKDVKTTSWYYSDVTECAKLGIVSGFEDGTFKPDNNVTAIQFLVMLTRTFYNSKVEAVKAPAGSTWYYANTKVASDVGMSKNLPAADINDTKGMTRYNMAVVLSNILTANGKTITAGTRAQAAASITDYNKIPANSGYHNPVTTCYGLGIITGMSDGSFAGAQSMTRAQACTVIMRMLKLINNYNPGDKDNDVYDDGTSQNTGNNQQSGKLANGKDATTANVLEILAQIKQEYPTGTIWGPQGTSGNHSYAGSINSTDVKTVTNQFRVYTGLNIDLTYACGGWMAMVSDRIFGQTGAPAREVTDPSKVRPGDIVINFNTNGRMTHVSIASESAHPEKTLSGATRYYFTCCEGNAGGKVNWGTNYIGLYTQSNGSYIRVFTRYPN